MLLRCRLLRSRPAARVDRSVLLLATAAAFTSYHTLPITSCASRRARWVVVAVVKGVGAAQLRPRRRLRLSVWHRAMRLWMPQGGRRRRESQALTPRTHPSHPPLATTACLQPSRAPSRAPSSSPRPARPTSASSRGSQDAPACQSPASAKATRFAEMASSSAALSRRPKTLEACGVRRGSKP